MTFDGIDDLELHRRRDVVIEELETLVNDAGKKLVKIAHLRDEYILIAEELLARAKHSDDAEH